MLLSKRAAAALPKRTLVCRAVLVLSTLGAATPHHAFAADESASAPAIHELAATEVHATIAPPPFARDTPAVVQTVTADQLADRNIVTTEDAVKYQPNVMVRRRFIGDRNSIFAGRDFNEIQSARGLLYADGILLSNLLGSSYTYPPRWSMVGPDDLARVDILYGPFSALYPGNSMGTTIAMTLRKPETFEAAAQTQVMRQHYNDAYGFSRNVTGNHESASLGDRIGKFWYALSVDRLENDSQPMQYATPNSRFTPGAAPVPVTGAVQDTGPNGQPRVILGPQMLERTQQLQETVRMGYVFSDRLEASLTLGHWENHYSDQAQSFLRDAAGNVVTGGNVRINGTPTTIAQNAFAPQNGDQENWLYGLGVKGKLGDWKIDANASAYNVTRDILRASNTAAGSGPGTVFYGDGTGWSNFDLKAVSPTVSGHTFTTGYHYDQYHLRNQTFNATTWCAETLSTLKSAYQGDTQTQAVFLQDAWAFAPRWLATLGLRYENWRAYNGQLASGTTAGTTTLGYASRTEDAFSPKAALQWQATQDTLLRLSYGRAVRFPTVAELFQGTISGNTIVNNDPNLKPERANDLDFTVEQAVPYGMLRTSLFQSDIRDSIYSQTNITVTPNVTNVQNVDRVRTRGIELAYSGQDVARDVGVRGVDIEANVAFTQAKTLADAANPTYVDKTWPRMPRVRANLFASWHATPDWTVGAGVRYSGRQYGTLDNTDVLPNVYGGTSRFFTVDLKASYRIDKHFTVALGVDNLTDRRYFVYHPYPSRTFYGQLKWRL
ncbi:MAG: TonB-dependent receptor [Ralstonia sp.]|nr:MAG: TonB-dependent receptor [Ralstonia sp.]